MKPDLKRIPNDRTLCLRPEDVLIVRKRGGGERQIAAGKWWINRNTPVGDEAELFERMPHQGYRNIEWKNLIAIERSL